MSDPDRILTHQQAVDAGWTSAQILRRVGSGEWRTLLRGIYLVDARGKGAIPAPVSVEIAAVAALTAGGADAVLAAEAAARVHRLPVPRRPGVPTVEVVLPRMRRVRQRRTRGAAIDVRWSWRRLAAEDVTTVDGLRVTTPQRTVLDLLPRLGRVDAVSLLDAALAEGSLSAEDLAHLRRRMVAKGARTAVRACDLADGRAQSPLETRIRLICCDAGIPPDILQYPVRDSTGQLLGYGDLAWVVAGRTVVLECDGAAYHDTPRAVFRDRHRQNDLQLANCLVLRVTWADADRPGYVVSAVRQALRQLRAA